MSERSGAVVPERGEYDHLAEGAGPDRASGRTWMLRGLALALVMVVWVLGGADVSGDARVVPDR